ncbi:NADP-dependent oxidoreductase [Dactylosporangium cerinum]|uniref:NADP-dependent oxidoreductase n=1 Tax=Dactylosporangium cerinum TaxID=1434730 RepID=A0ABV9W778_9ACTN
MDVMMAVRAHSRGGPERLLYEQAPQPEAGEGEVLVAVHAAAITFDELTWEESWTRDGVDRTPVIPSHEMCGTVAALGDGVTDLAIDDDVFALIDFDRNGAAAEYVTVPAVDLAGKPRMVSHVEAATLPLAALTAWQALVDHAKLMPGEQVLVHGGAGGVGVYAVQLATILGGHVTATCRGTDASFVRRLGADRVIDYTTEGFDETASRFDVVVDTVGGAILERSYGVLRPGGRLVTLGAPPAKEMANRHGVEAVFFIVRPDSAQLAHLAQLVDDGRLRPVVAQTFPLSQARQAYENPGREHRPGKTVLVIRGLDRAGE